MKRSRSPVSPGSVLRLLGVGLFLLPAIARADGPADQPTAAPPRVEVTGERPIVLPPAGGRATFQVENTGGSPLQVIEIRVRTSDRMPAAPGFSVQSNGLPVTLAPGEKHEA